MRNAKQPFTEEAMKKIAFFALVALIAVASLAPAAGEQLGIEVLGIEVLADGSTSVYAHTPMAPAGSSADALVHFGGYTMQVDAAPIDPATGMASVQFPAGTYTPDAAIAVRGPSGELLSAGGYAEGVDFD